MAANKEIVQGHLERIKDIFQNNDGNGDGFISKEELMTVLRGLGERSHVPWTDDMVDELFEAANKSQGNKIRYEEFVDWLFSADPEKAATKLIFRMTDLKGRWHSTDFYPPEDGTQKFHEEQDIAVTEEQVVATKFTDGGDPYVPAGNTTWFFDLPANPSFGAAFSGQLRGGGTSGKPEDFFWQPARFTVVDPDTIEVYLPQNNYYGHFRRGGLEAKLCMTDLTGRWHSTDFYPPEDGTLKFHEEQDIAVTEEQVVATKFNDGGDPYVPAGNTTWFFDLPVNPAFGAAFSGQLRGGGPSGKPEEFFWQPARFTVVDRDTIEVYLPQNDYLGHFRRGRL